MRLFFSFALLAVGTGLCLLNAMAHAFANSGSTKYYHEQLQRLPEKDTYSRTELTEAVWQIWTNKMSLPEQEHYTVGELKSAMSKTMLGTHQDSCHVSLFRYYIGKACGYKGPSENGLTVVGVLVMLTGAVVLGTALTRCKEPNG